MKNPPPLIAVALALFPLTSLHTSGAELLSEDFSYADGSLTDSVAWSDFSGTTGDLMVSSGQAVVQHGVPSEDAQAAFSEQTSGVVYYGVDFSVADLGAPYSGSDNEYFVFFKDSGFNFTGRVDIVPPSGTGDFSVGVASADSTADATWGSDLTYGLVYRLVVKHDIDINQSTLWINPTAEGDTSIVGDDAENVRDVVAIALRQSDSSENETVTVDNLVVATTFTEALGVVPTETLTVGLSTTSVAEDAGTGPVDVTVTRSGDATAALDVILVSGDTSEAVIATPNVQIPAGQASATFTMAIDIVDDSLVDGDQSVVITASAAGFIAGSETLTVTDAGDAVSLVINEVYSVVDGTDGDANGDGSTGFQDDEFIEIVNYGSTTVDLSLHKLTDATRDIHFFPFGTTLEPGCALLVFGGGTMFEGTVAGVFGNAEVQKSSQGLLFLTDTGDTVSIVDDTDTTIFSVTIPDLESSPAEGSYNLDPDGTAPVGVPAYARHVTLSGMATEQFSPGTTVSGTAFCPVPSQALTLTVDNGTVPEDGGTEVATATISIPAALEDLLPVYLETGDPGELLVQPIDLIIPPGETEVTVPLDAVNDTDVDGTQTVVLSAHASGYANGTTTVDVTDDGDVPLEGDLFFSEYAEGSSNNKYLEIYNPTAVVLSLDGYAYPSVSNAPDNGAGNYDFWNEFEPGATIGPGEVYIIAHPSADPSILDVADETFSFLSNGDDGFALVKGSEADFSVIDWIGNWDGDPGSGWDVAGVTNGTQNHTLVRKNTVTEGNTDWDASRGTNADDSEWIVLDIDDWTSLGTHPNTESGGGLLITGTSFNFAANEVTLTVTGLDAENGVYAVEHSTDLGQDDPWELVVESGFIVGLPNVIESPEGSGIYAVTITDAELATETANYYRVSEQ